MVNELLEEQEITPELSEQLKRIVKSSDNINEKTPVQKSAFFSRLVNLMEQVKKKGSSINELINKSKGCVEIINKILENIDLLKDAL